MYGVEPVEKILPETAGVLVKWYTNFSIANGGLPSDVVNIATGIPTLSRSGEALDEQFDYHFSVTANHSAAVFLAQFRQSFTIFMIAHTDAEALSLPAGADLLRPRRF